MTEAQSRNILTGILCAIGGSVMLSMNDLFIKQLSLGYALHQVILVRALVYLSSLGPDGLRQVSRTAILNANYLMRRLEKTYELPYAQACMHEFVLSGRRLRKHGVKTLDVAKRLLDFGVHAPTVYFPLIVEEALMIEPTETETLDRLDHFAEAMERIAREAAENPDLLRDAPLTTPVSRLDEGRAARELKVHWKTSEPGARQAPQAMTTRT